MNKLEKGYFQIYTGSAKGKTTAALGLALRAAGSGLKTYIGQFLKRQEYGELKAAEAFLADYVEIEQYGEEGFLSTKGSPDPKDVEMARKGLAKAREKMLSGEFDIIIFDEINIAHHFGLLSLTEIMEVINEKPEKVEIIFTGRYASVELVKIADLVTEMVEVKHYFKDDVQSRIGIEK